MRGSATWGGLMRSHRRMMGLTQDQLARSSKLGVRTIRELERGRAQPRSETVRLLADALRLDGPARTAFVRAAIEGDMPHAFPVLPAPPTSFVGREREMAEALDLLRDGVRLLTLVGPPGVGKTRLALAVVSEAAPAHDATAVFVDLAPIVDPALLEETIKRAMGVYDPGRLDPLECLVRHIADRRVLMLLDNFEHLLDASPRLGKLLTRCPNLHVVVTSRAALGVRHEQQQPVEPLPPADAVALFERRVRAVVPEFRLDAGTRAVVTEICRRLDGLPLALELAAAWSKLLDPEALLRRLERPLAMLDMGPRDSHEHQRTMRRTLEWSYDLLQPAEQALFRRISVFAGGVPLNAVETVCSAAGPLGGDPLHLLAGLLHKSLAFRETGETERARQLLTLREFGLELLEASCELETTARAHCHHYAALAADAQLVGGRQDAWLRRLAREHDNIRAALRWARDSGESELALVMLRRTFRFWNTQGHRREGLRWLDELLASPDEVADAVRADSLQAGASLAIGIGDAHRALALAEQSAALYRPLGDRKGMAGALRTKAVLAQMRGHLEQATTLLEASLQLVRAVEDQRIVASTLNTLGNVLVDCGEHARALPVLEEALAIGRRLGDKFTLACALINLGDLACKRDELDRAEACFEESVALCRQVDDVGYLVVALYNLGAVARGRGDAALAAARYRESLDIAVRIDARRRVGRCLEGLAYVAWTQQQAEKAARLYAAAAKLREDLGAPARFDEDDERTVGEVRKALGATRFSAAWTAGSHLTPVEAAGEARTA